MRPPIKYFHGGNSTVEFSKRFHEFAPKECPKPENFADVPNGQPQFRHTLGSLFCCSNGNQIHEAIFEVGAMMSAPSVLESCHS